MCTIRRARIKKLIKQQRKGSHKGDLFLIDLTYLPVMDVNKWKEAINLMNQKGVMVTDSIPHVQRIRSTRPRNL
jgi:hypothetical protein